MRRVSASMLKRLERIEQMRSERRPYAAFPPIMGHAEWEAVAVVMQEALMSDTHKDMYIVQPAEQPQQENTQADHEREYQEHKKRVDAGAREYLEHKRQRVRGTVAR